MTYPPFIRCLAISAALSAVLPRLSTVAASENDPGAPEYPRMGPDIFERHVPAEALLAEAIQLAQQNHRRIVLLLGANWCPYCRRLHSIIEADAAVRRELADRYVFLYIDANWRTDRNRNARFLEKLGNPIKQLGLPSLVLLDADGRKLATQGTQPLAARTDEEVSRNLLALLRQWHD